MALLTLYKTKKVFVAKSLRCKLQNLKVAWMQKRVRLNNPSLYPS